MQSKVLVKDIYHGPVGEALWNPWSTNSLHYLYLLLTLLAVLELDDVRRLVGSHYNRLIRHRDKVRFYTDRTVVPVLHTIHIGEFMYLWITVLCVK